VLRPLVAAAPAAARAAALQQRAFPLPIALLVAVLAPRLLYELLYVHAKGALALVAICETSLPLCPVERLPGLAVGATFAVLASRGGQGLCKILLVDGTDLGNGAARAIGEPSPLPAASDGAASPPASCQVCVISVSSSPVSVASASISSLAVPAIFSFLVLAVVAGFLKVAA